MNVFNVETLDLRASTLECLSEFPFFFFIFFLRSKKNSNGPLERNFVCAPNVRITQPRKDTSYISLVNHGGNKNICPPPLR